MLTKLSIPINKLTTTRIWYYIENLLVVSLLFYCIISLTDYDNAFYQVWKSQASARAVLAFTAIVFIIRKVKLLNWQSLVATLFFSVVVFERMHFWSDAEDILNAVKPQLVTEWLSLMIIIDMILYKNVNNLFKGLNYILILYAFLTIGMLWRRHDRMDPIILIFPMFLFALVKMDDVRKEWFMRRFIDGWFISFIYVCVKSFLYYPYTGDRYYGCFINIGPFGIFMTCSLTVAIISLIYSKNNLPKRFFPLSLSIIWIISNAYMLWLINTRTIIITLAFVITFVFIFVSKKDAKKNLAHRWTIVIVSYFSILVLLFFLVIALSKVSTDYIEKTFNGALSPLYYLVLKLKNVSNYAETASTGEKLYTIIDKFSSNRLHIFKEYSQYFNYDGNDTFGIEIDVESYLSYWAYGAHNTYVQFLFEYGYISFVELIVTIVLALRLFTINYLKTKSISNLFPALWITTMLGSWLGESTMFFYPITFFGIMFIALLLADTCNYDSQNHQKTNNI